MKLGQASIELHEAISARSDALARRALQAGADAHSIHDGTTPLCRVVKTCNERLISCQNQEKIEALLNILLGVGISARERSDALSLASKLIKKNAQYSYHKGNQVLNDTVIPKLESAAGATSVPTTTIARSTVQTYRKLLFSERHSDVRFVFPDGKVLYAHQNILGEASDFFERCFDGQWRERQEEGFVFESTHSKPTLEMVLSFIYTGDLDASRIEEDPGEMLSVTQQYELSELHHLTEQICIQNISLSSVKAWLLMSHLFDAAGLKQACFGFIRTNAAKALLNKSITSLEEEQPELWAELVAAMGA